MFMAPNVADRVPTSRVRRVPSGLDCGRASACGVAHGRRRGSNDVILGLLRNAPPDVLPACVFLDEGPTVDAVRAMGFDGRVLRAGRARDVRRMAVCDPRALTAHPGAHSDVVFAHASKAQVYAGCAATIVRVPNVWYQHEVPGYSRAAPGMNRVLGSSPRVADQSGHLQLELRRRCAGAALASMPVRLDPPRRPNRGSGGADAHGSRRCPDRRGRSAAALEAPGTGA